ncbi:uncharacterized protein EV422DRAFT_565895 [Fimicolochytrium jonesii]|uniref:uncharacterized protein n=1 Tax=Fimicolochytrium jonesii TaxID=1396493 RepID=UPI0022FEF4FA|nr:uncharacterized protein EV422DRAFT_565895 [Fimicolochytrium jonesii]KAI8823032.1 hypothetical protein EV422DRAFT_565895 [Fimicolochytrium jonesii]
MFFWTLVLFALFFTKGLTGELGPCANIDEWGYCQDEQRLAANKADYPWVIEIILLFAGCVVPYLGVFFLLRFMDPDKLSHYIHYIWTFTTIWATGASLGIRSFIVDPDGDAMFYSLLDLTAVVVIPMVTSLPFHCTLLLVVINLIAVVAILWTRFASKLLGSSVCAFLYIFVGTFTILIHVRDNEKEERRRYIAETELRYMNAGLKDRLAGLQRQLSEQMADLETPLEKALITIKSVMANPRLDKSSFDHLAKALGWLGNSNKLFTPNLEQQLHGGLVGVNKDQEQWLLQMLSDQLGHRRKQPGHRTQPPMTSRLGGGGAINTNLSDLELFASYIAAAIHGKNVNHPGLNNKFLIETHDPLAVLYNDRSVLENHHLATAFSIMYQEDTNIVENFSLDDAHKFRELVISMVLATDVTNHFTKLAMFKNKLSAPGAFDPANNTEDRNLFLEMAIKCADVSNLSREWPVYFEWLNRLILEFLNQGDEERRRGMPVSPFMDREKINIPQSQIGFIDYMCLPSEFRDMFEVLAKATPLPPMLELLAENREKLSLMKDEDAKQNMAGFSKVVRTSEIDD